MSDEMGSIFIALGSIVLVNKKVIAIYFILPRSFAKPEQSHWLAKTQAKF